MTPPIKRTAKNKKEYESFGELTKRQAAALKKFEESVTAGEKNRSALKQLKRVFPQGLGNLVLGAGQSLVDKEGGKKRMKKGARSLDTASATSQRMDIKEERARKEHNEKFGVKRLNKGGGLNAAIDRVKKAQGMEEGGAAKKPDKSFRPKKIRPYVPPTQEQLDELGSFRPKMERAKPISKEDVEAIKKLLKPIKYKKGGAAFPDLTGDGKVTQKDILRGRGVKGFKQGGEVRGMGRAYMGAPRKVKIR